jgi:hypothetical protein
LAFRINPWQRIVLLAAAGLCFWYAFTLLSGNDQSPVFSVAVGTSFLLIGLTKPLDGERIFPVVWSPKAKHIKFAALAAVGVGAALFVLAYHQQSIAAAQARAYLATEARLGSELKAKIDACQRVGVAVPDRVPSADRAKFLQAGKSACEALARGELIEVEQLLTSLRDQIGYQRLPEAISKSPASTLPFKKTTDPVIPFDYLEREKRRAQSRQGSDPIAEAMGILRQEQIRSTIIRAPDAAKDHRSPKRH